MGKGYNTKRRHAQKCLADTVVTDYHGRAVCFVSGPASGLTKTLPAALAQLRTVTGQAKIMLGFDRGGSYASVFTHCREHGVDWITYRRGTLAATTAPVRRHWRVDAAGRAEVVSLADEMVTIKDYGPARQLTLYEHDQAVLQVLTSDLTAPAAALLAWLRCRWRIENVFKYLTAHHGIDWLCHYGADITPDTTLIDNPARKQARNTLKRAETTLADAQRAFTELLHSELSVTATNAAIPAAETKIDTARAEVARAREKLKTIPAKIPANQHDPNAQRAIPRTQRRSLQMVLRLLAFNAEQWLAGEAEDSLLGAAILAHAAFIPGWEGDREGASDRLTAARSHARRAETSGLMWAWLDAVDAECATLSGDTTEALNLISRAESHLRDDPSLSKPEWMDWFTPVRLGAFKGNVELKAGQTRRAEKTLSEALAGSPPDDTKQRAVILADLAAAELAQKRVVRCCERLGEALDELAQQWYATAMERIRDVRRALRPWQDEQCVHALDERLYDWKTAVNVLRS